MRNLIEFNQIYLVCPVEFIRLENGKCYKLVSIKKNYDSATQHCRILNAKLAEPISEQDNNAIGSRWKNLNIWLGINDKAVEGR